MSDVEFFERKVLESSLIKVLLSPSYPEIGEFLHLPEIDPEIVDGFSREIVEKCIGKLISKVLTTIDIELIKKLLTKYGIKASSKKKEELEHKQAQLQDYIFGLKGIEYDTPEQSDEKWASLRDSVIKEESEAEKAVEDKYYLEILWKIAYAIPFGIPLWIHKLIFKKN